MDNRRARKGEIVKIVAEFRHWRSGKIIKASDFGYKGFPIRSAKKKPK